MPRQVRPWFRVYTEMVRDRKIRRLTPAQRWIWVAILCAAGESPERGRLVVVHGVPMTAAELADYADVRTQDVNKAVKLMIKLGMLEDQTTVEARAELEPSQTPAIVVLNWSQRQYESDNVTARTRKLRAGIPRNTGQTEMFGTFPDRSNEAYPQGRRNVPEYDVGTDQRQIQKQTQNYVGVNKGEDRNETLPARPATKPTPKNDDEPTCSKHPYGDSDTPCSGCARVREWRDHAEDRHRAATERAATIALQTCPDCQGGIWLDNGTKCTHPKTRNPGQRVN